MCVSSKSHQEIRRFPCVSTTVCIKCVILGGVEDICCALVQGLFSGFVVNLQTVYITKLRD